MGLNEAKGNMYSFITHTFNTIKGKCPHDCAYCYMKRWGGLSNTHFDSKELKTDMGEGNFIFVGSSCDMFAEDIPDEWILTTLDKCECADKNKYLFQSKNPARIKTYGDYLANMEAVVCTTLETNRWYPDIMRNAPKIEDRVMGMESLKVKKYVTIEPIMDFDLSPFVELVKRCEPEQVNIGADSGNNNLPEPTAEKIIMLTDELRKFTTIANKRNLSRILEATN